MACLFVDIPCNMVFPTQKIAFWVYFYFYFMLLAYGRYMNIRSVNFQVLFKTKFDISWFCFNKFLWLNFLYSILIFWPIWFLYTHHLWQFYFHLVKVKKLKTYIQLGYWVKVHVDIYVALRFSYLNRRNWQKQHVHPSDTISYFWNLTNNFQYQCKKHIHHSKIITLIIWLNGYSL